MSSREPFDDHNRALYVGDYEDDTSGHYDDAPENRHVGRWVALGAVAIGTVVFAGVAIGHGTNSTLPHDSASALPVITSTQESPITTYPTTTSENTTTAADTTEATASTTEAPQT